MITPFAYVVAQILKCHAFAINDVARLDLKILKLH